MLRPARPGVLGYRRVAPGAVVSLLRDGLASWVGVVDEGGAVRIDASKIGVGPLTLAVGFPEAVMEYAIDVRP